jgi:hypothetical protein
MPAAVPSVSPRTSVYFFAIEQMQVYLGGFDACIFAFLPQFAKPAVAQRSALTKYSGYEAEGIETGYTSLR